MNKVRVLLVSAIQKELYFKQAPRRRALGDLGIRYIAAYLNENGIKTEIMPSYEYTQQSLLSFIEQNDGICAIGFSMHTISADNSLTDVRAVKALYPHIKIWLGGFLPTFGWRFLLETDCPFDYIMRGYGEIASFELCKKIVNGDADIAIRGIIVKDNPSTYCDDFCEVPNIEQLPLPYFSQKDKQQNVGEYMVSASRGCYGRCSFCSIPAFNERRCERSVESVISELRYLKSDYDAKFIDFVDDSFLGAMLFEERAQQFASAVKACGLNLPFRISMRANNVTDSVIQNLKAAGLVAVQLGVESFSPRQVKLYNKGVNCERALQAIRTIERNGVYVQCGLILFEPSTTLEDLKINANILIDESWAVVKSNNQILYCAEGTGLGNRLKEEGKANEVDGYLNYRWTYCDERVEVVYKAVTEYERELGGYSNILVDAITPPSVISEKLPQMRVLQNEYQKLSFKVLLYACELVEKTDDVKQIKELIDARFGNGFSAIVQKTNSIIKECKNG